MARNPPHDAAIQKGMKMWLRVSPPGWDLRVQSAVTLMNSEPEPDFAIVRGDENTYLTRHPAAADIGLVIEVSDSTLPGDRDDKGRIYASSAIAFYWIVNLINRQVEVYTSPLGSMSPTPGYASRTDYRPGDTVPLSLPGAPTILVAVQDLLP
jgi:Uma2 family endonuclease